MYHKQQVLNLHMSQDHSAWIKKQMFVQLEKEIRSNPLGILKDWFVSHLARPKHVRSLSIYVVMTCNKHIAYAEILPWKAILNEQ